MNQTERNIRDDYLFKKTIGCGAFGRVVVAVNIQTKKQVAIKIISKITPHMTPKRFIKETNIIKNIQHPNIMEYLDRYEDAENYYIVTEYIKHGELYNYIVTNDISIKKCKKIFCQLLSALEYCHGNLMAHRDIKLENIMISQDKKMKIKLIDFGFATRLNLHSMHKKKCGSPYYAAPEIIYDKQYNPFKADVWSLGVVLYALITKIFPFPDPKIQSTFVYNDLTNRYEIIDYNSLLITDPLLKNLFSNIFVTPENRINITQLKNHPWLRGMTIKSYLCPMSSLAPMNYSVIEKMVGLGFNYSEVIKSIIHKTKTVELMVYNYLFTYLSELQSNKVKSHNGINRERLSEPVNSVDSVDNVNSVDSVDITTGYLSNHRLNCQKILHH